MTTRNQRRRPGVTLMEVLIATFILSIGLLAIMALFPIGAVNMARAINQDRSATHGVNSDVVFRYYWKQAWNDPNGGTLRPNAAEAYAYSQEPFLVYLESHPDIGTIPPGSSQPSFPVLVDPVGHLTQSGVGQTRVATQLGMPIRTTLRRCIRYPNPNANPLMIPGYSTFNPTLFPATGGVDTNFQPLWPVPPAPSPAPVVPYPQIIPAVVRLTTLPDDMTFAIPNDGSVNAVNGEPADFTGQIDRGGRYNVAWLLQRPRNDVPTEVNVTVLVYAGRSPTDTPSGELPYTGVSYATPGGTSIVILPPPAANNPLPAGIRRGGWIGYSHPVPLTDRGTPLDRGYPSMDFYRVTGFNTDTPNRLLIETETPIKRAGPTLPGDVDPLTGQPAYRGTAIVFDNLVEVFDRGTVSAGGVTR